MRHTSAAPSENLARPERRHDGRVLGRGGFTLLEALIASVLGAVVIGLVLSVVIAQGEHFRRSAVSPERSGSVRAAADLLHEELQNVTRRGVVLANPFRLVVRVPLSIGVVCEAAGPGSGGGPASVYLPVPGGGITSQRVSGWGYLSGSDWVYSFASWESLHSPLGDPEDVCARVGANTAGVGYEFQSLTNLTAAAVAGDILQLFTLVEYTLGNSLLRPGSRALFRREGGGQPVEYVTGLTPASRFEYRRRDQTNFETLVTSGTDLANIEEFRVTLEAEAAEPGEAVPESYRWSFRIPLRNVP